MAAVAKQGGWDAALKSQQLQSKIGLWAIKKVPLLAGKIAVKGATGVAIQGVPVVGNIVGAGMLMWTGNDIRKLVMETPELLDMVYEWATEEGESYEAAPPSKTKAGKAVAGTLDDKTQQIFNSLISGGQEQFYQRLEQLEKSNPDAYDKIMSSIETK